MSDIVQILLIIIWLMLSSFLAFKWSKIVERDAKSLTIFLSFVLTPLVLIIAIIRQLIIEDWK